MTYDIKEYQERLINMMAIFHQFCKDNGIRYSIYAGSMLGAVRHHGMIPWDDDIDVVMPRPDYDNFLRITQKSFVDGYRVVSPYNDTTLYTAYSKIIDCSTTLVEFRKHKDNVIGVFIDVFPVDGVPNNKKKQITLYKRFKRCKYLGVLAHGRYKWEECECKSEAKRVLLYLTHLLLRNFSFTKKLLRKADRIAASCNMNSSDMVRVYSSPHYGHKLIKKCFFDKYIEIPFETITVSCIKNYDEYLTELYGDYMTPPPIDKRVSEHEHYFIDLHHGYTYDQINKYL